jgi:hypothetical protein
MEVCATADHYKRSKTMPTILLIILLILLLGGGGYGLSAGWGMYPTGGIGLLVVIVIVLMVVGRA